MSISSLCHSNLKFSRLLNESEIEEINSLNHLEVHECFVEQHYNTCQKLGLKFDCLNEWRHLGGELVLTKNEENSCWKENYFIIESLMYILDNFVKPKNIKLEGFIVSIDEIFGHCLILQITNNQICVLKELTDYFDHLDLNLDLKFESMVKYVFKN
jgi:hypothetical protein